MLETKTLLQNRYLIEKQIGSGGMGAVYRAIDQRFGSFVAIKETFYNDKELGSAFEREAHLLNSLHHPALPHVSDYFIESNGHFLVMQFIEGEDLFEILKRDGVFPFPDVMRWADSLLDALDYLHSQNPPIIHRDIKPQNLKITPRRDIILLDFGLAKLNSDNDTGMKSVFGYSRKYSPLEQIQGTGTDVRSDLFALAATVYHLLTGKPPLDALTRAAAIVNGEPDPLRSASEINSAIPEGLANALNAALALNASKRFGSAKAMRQALKHAAASEAAGVTEVLSGAIFPAAEPLAATSAQGIESFPALESFVAEITNHGHADANIVEIPPANKEIVSGRDDNQPVLSDTSGNQQSSAAVIESLPRPVIISTVESGVFHKKHSRVGAAILAVLVCAGLSTWYFTEAANSPVEASREAVIQTESAPVSDTKSATGTTTPPEPAPVRFDAAVTAAAEVKKTPVNKPIKNDAGVVKKTELVVEESPVLLPVEPIEKPKPVRNKVENKIITVAKSPKVNAAPRRTIPAESNVSPEIPDIESVFTGQSSEEREQKQQRRENRRLREQMSPEEREEFRRNRRERQRNRQPLPPF